MIRKIATTMIFLAGGFSVLVGFMGLIASEFTPYHAQAVGKTWSQIEAGIQSIILAMMTIEGSGFMATGLAILFLIIPIRRGELWAYWATLIVASANWIPTLYVAIALRNHFPEAETPIIPTAAFIAFVLIGVGLFFLDRRKLQNQQG